MVYSLFLSPLHQAWPDNVNDAQESKLAVRLMNGNRYNVLYKTVAHYALDSAEAKTVQIPNIAAVEWLWVVVRCIGSGQVYITGLDEDGITVTDSYLQLYGNSIFPGIGLVSLYNTTAVEIQSSADGSLFEVMAAIACADDDARLDTNA